MMDCILDVYRDHMDFYFRNQKKLEAGLFDDDPLISQDCCDFLDALKTYSHTEELQDFVWIARARERLEQMGYVE